MSPPAGLAAVTVPHALSCDALPVAPLHLANATHLVLSGNFDKFDNLLIILGFVFLLGCL